MRIWRNFHTIRRHIYQDSHGDDPSEQSKSPVVHSPVRPVYHGPVTPVNNYVNLRAHLAAEQYEVRHGW